MHRESSSFYKRDIAIERYIGQCNYIREIMLDTGKDGTVGLIRALIVETSIEGE